VRCERCVAVREKEEGVSRRHGEHGVSEEVERWFVRCERCVAVREKEKKVSHGGTASTAKGGNCKTSLCAVIVVSL